MVNASTPTPSGVSPPHGVMLWVQSAPAGEVVLDNAVRLVRIDQRTIGGDADDVLGADLAAAPT